MAPAAGDPRASRWEILGAWLHVWTPPRDVEVPPPPRRALAVAAVLLTVAIVAILALVAPVIDQSKQRAAEQRERTAAAGLRAQRARLAAVQRAHHARSPAAARLYSSRRHNQSRDALLQAVRASIGRDVRARVAAGELRGQARAVHCRPRRGQRGARVRLYCLAVTARATPRGMTGVELAHPFVVGGSLRDGRYAWCKAHPRPGEGMTGRSVVVELPRACAG